MSGDPRSPSTRRARAYSRTTWKGGASAKLRRDPLALRLLVHNLMDQRADTFAFGSFVSLAQQRQLTPLRPWTLTLRIARDV